MKKLITILIITAMIICLAGCDYKSYDFIDTNYHFNKAIIKMPDGEIITVDIDKWSDSEGEQLTITTKDGKRYLVNSINCILVEED